MSNAWCFPDENPATRGTYLCRLAAYAPSDVQYVGLLWDEGWYGQGCRSITHWMALPELPALASNPQVDQGTIRARLQQIRDLAEPSQASTPDDCRLLARIADICEGALA